MAILLRRNIRGLVAIGDPQQLPSVISNQDLRIKGFAVSMFERLLKAGSPFTLLDIQYRMHPQISLWPSEAFYEGEIVNGNNVQNPGRSPSWQKSDALITAPYSFFDIPGVEERNNDTRSYKNTIEADIIVGDLSSLIAKLKAVDYDGSVEIGCVTGYTEQVQLLNRKISSILPSAKFWQTTSRIDRVEITCSAHCNAIIDIASVDAFQGQERDIMLFATTRANPQHNIGFLSKPDVILLGHHVLMSSALSGDPRRLNVALTRARYVLKVFGNASTLSSSPTWAALVKNARDRGVYREASSCLQDLRMAPKKLVAAKRDEKVSVLRTRCADQPVKIAEGIDQLASVHLNLDSAWRVVFTKTCKQQTQELDKGGAAFLVKSFEVFSNGYPPRSARIGYEVRGMPAFVKRLKIKDRTLLWSVRVLAVPKSAVSTEGNHLYSQAIWVWAYPPNIALEETMRCVLNACKTFTDEYLDLCAAENWSEGKILPFVYAREAAIVERKRCDVGAPREVPTEINELDLAKAYEVTPRVQRALIEGFLSTVELPFVLSSEETALVHDPQSTFVIGRSGTVSILQKNRRCAES